DAAANDNTARLHVLIHPHPTAATSGQHWADPDRQPTFVQTAMRAISMQRSQSLYADLRQAEKTNSRIEWIQALCGDLGDALDRLPEPHRSEVVAALTATVRQIETQKAGLRAAGSHQAPTTASASQQSQPSDLLAEAVHVASGIGGKRPARIDVISPLLLRDVADGSHSVEQLLSGELLDHFGCFYDEALRRSDFDLGFVSTTQWLADLDPDEIGLTTGELDVAREALASGPYRPGAGWQRTGGTRLPSLLRAHPLLTLRLLGRVARVLVHDTRKRPAP
ncbi:MAG TPA: hypothetical protein VE197_20755, partial [Mycobacterium sp.]|nr:hypothetical protein [Mycobacterium sp.]